jgi:hypothetical protein
MSLNDALVEYARTIDQAAELLVKATKDTHVPAELLYDLSGFLGSAMGRLAKLYPQLADGVRAAGAMNQVHDRNRDPLESIVIAVGWLAQATEGSEYLLHCLSGAQTAIDGQTTITERPAAPATASELFQFLADGDRVQNPFEVPEVDPAAVVAAGLACARCATVLIVTDETPVCPNGHPQDGDAHP